MHIERSDFWSEVFASRLLVSPNIKWRIFLFGAISAIVWAVSLTDLIPTSGVAPYEIIGVVLALLLVLRTNSGYDRWYEGRKLWGGIVNQSRNLAQIGLNYGPQDEKWRDQFIRWTVAFCHVSRHSLRSEKDLSDMHGVLSGPQLDQLASAQHMPMYVANRLAALLRQAMDDNDMDPIAFMQAEQQRNQLIDHIGACERILKTPLAKAFSVKIRRFLFLYLVALPFGVFDKSGMLTPVIVMLVAYPLLSLDQIGVELQDPFSSHRISHLPLTDICQGIQNNLMPLIERDDDTLPAGERTEMVA